MTKEERERLLILRRKEELYAYQYWDFPFFTIYQVDDSFEREEGYQNYQERKQPILESHFQPVYLEKMEMGKNEYRFLETLYERFNIGSRPKGYAGHSLSVGDVVVLDFITETKAYYCDTFGFRMLKPEEFVTQLYKREYAALGRKVKIGLDQEEKNGTLYIVDPDTYREASGTESIRVFSRMEEALDAYFSLQKDFPEINFSERKIIPYLASIEVTDHSVHKLIENGFITEEAQLDYGIEKRVRQKAEILMGTVKERAL